LILRIRIFPFCAVGWVDIRISNKGKRRYVVSLAKVWEIANKCHKSIDLYRRGYDFKTEVKVIPYSTST
jgi:hypothetical protein